jgi:hypothetical protein
VTNWQPPAGSLLGIESLDPQQISDYLKLARQMDKVYDRGSNLLKGKRIVLLFFGLLFAWRLHRVETGPRGHGLETITTHGGAK